MTLKIKAKELTYGKMLEVLLYHVITEKTILNLQTSLDTWRLLLWTSAKTLGKQKVRKICWGKTINFPFDQLQVTTAAGFRYPVISKSLW